MQLEILHYESVNTEGFIQKLTLPALIINSYHSKEIL